MEAIRGIMEVLISKTLQKGNRLNFQPIAVPAIAANESKDRTGNFGSKAQFSIGEGAYDKVYRSVLKSGCDSAIKKLADKEQPEREILAQISVVSRLKRENVVELLGYCVDGRIMTALSMPCPMNMPLMALFTIFSMLAAVAALCLQCEADFRPNMSIVVKALQPLASSGSW